MALVLCTALPWNAFADSLDAARAAGLVGERPDGYVDFVTPNPTPDLQNLVNSINAQRRKVYEQLAGEKGVPAEEVGALAAEKTISQRLKPGWYYLSSSGQWVKK
ncbi:MAG TPA: YdbL family protein [Dongiaceae bacterium]|jgi:hypothetical protein